MEANDIESLADFTDPDNDDYYLSLDIKIEGADDIDKFIEEEQAKIDLDIKALEEKKKKVADETKVYKKKSTRGYSFTKMFLITMVTLLCCMGCIWQFVKPDNTE